MNKILKIIGLLGSLGLASIAFAEISPQDQLADLMSDLQASQGKFEQVIYSAKGMALQTSQGTFALKRPGQFRWQTLSPTPQLLIADGSKVWLYDHDLNQVSWFKEQVNNQQSPAMLLVGDVSHLATLYQIRVKHHADQVAFSLTPLKTSFFEQVQLIFAGDDDDLSLSEMVIKDNLSQTTRIHFSELTDGADAKLFHFTPPPSADLVEAAM